jgi:hypothetical protein
MGNPRVHKALKTQMEKLYEEFTRLCSASDISPEALRVLEATMKIYNEMKNGGNEK